MTNGGVFKNEKSEESFPERQWVNNSQCTEKLKSLLEKDADNSTIEYWENLKKSTKSLGAFKAMPEKSVVCVFFAENTTYNKYIQVRDEVQAAVNDLRDEIAGEITGKTFDKLEKGSDREREIRNAIQVVYPLSVSDQQLEENRKPPGRAGGLSLYCYFKLVNIRPH